MLKRLLLPFCALLVPVSLAQTGFYGVATQPFRVPEVRGGRPKFSPSYVVHITPSVGRRNGNYSSDDFLVLEGVTVPEAIERLYDVTPTRLLLPASLQSATLYDFALLLPAPESPAKMKARMAQALQDFFHVDMEHETRISDVYVVGLAPGRKPPRLTGNEPGASGSARASSIGLREASGPDTATRMIHPQSLGAVFSLDEEGTIDDLCRDLERSLDRPVVNETRLGGMYKIQAQIGADSSDDFVERLREHTGLTISPARRTADFLRFEPAR